MEVHNHILAVFGTTCAMQSAKRQTCHRVVCNKQNDVRTVSFVHKNTRP